MALLPKQKLTIFSLLSKGVQHNISTDNLYLTLSQKGPDEFKQLFAESAVFIKKRHSFPTAGAQSGLFDERESRALKVAMDNDCLMNALNTFANYYKARLNYKSHFQHLWPYFLFLILALILAPFPDLYSGKITTGMFLLTTALPLLLLVVVMMIFNNPRRLISNNFSMSMGLPQLLMKVPTLGKMHIHHEMTRFLENIGLLRSCGYTWKHAVEQSVPSVANELIRKKLGVILVRMQRRDSFVDALKACEYFPEHYIVPLEKAQAANALAQTMIRFGTNHLHKGEKRIQDEVKMPAIMLAITSFALIVYAGLKTYTLLTAT